jgi:hypothetical protein
MATTFDEPVVHGLKNRVSMGEGVLTSLTFFGFELRSFSFELQVV